MRIVKFLIVFLFTCSLVYILNNPIKNTSRDIPPLGKLLNPFTGFWNNSEATNNLQDETISITELTGKVEVLYDEQLIPHIFAQNLEDAFFVQGYITAKHRLWQMDISTRAASGRLSEVLGPITLENDKLQRRRGMVFGAQNTLANWRNFPEDFKNLEKYTAGVNAYVQTLSPRDYPIEFKLLDYKPEAWTNLKSALFLKSMAQSLCMRENDLESTNALHVFGQETFDFLYPLQNPKQSPIVPKETIWDFEPVDLPERKPVLMGLYDHKPYEKPSPFLGSNNWAVAGAKTKSGNPILCNDPHLGLTLPSIWFEIQITTPEGSSYGVSLPGFPGIIIGFNEHVSWGSTNVGQDVVDFYKILWADKEHEKYFIDDQVKSINLRYETFLVKGQEAVHDTVRYTDWGPVVYEDQNHGMNDLAMRWIAHDGSSNELSVFKKLHQASVFDDFYDAVQEFVVPPQNLVYADQKGDVAIKIQGKFPLKRKDQGRFIMDGSNSDNAWYGFIPPAHNPQTKNPARNYVASANQHSTDPSYPYFYNGGFDDYRGRALNGFLDSLSDITIQDMMDLQNNTYSQKAADAMPLMLQHLDWQANSDSEKSILKELKEWNYYFDKELLAPVFFDYWYKDFYSLVWDEIIQKEDSLSIELLYPETWRTIALLEEDPSNLFFDILNTPKKETAKDLIALSFKNSLEKIKDHLQENPEYSLAVHKNTKVPHLGRIPAFSSPFLSVGGDGSSLNAIRGTHGPSWRMIVDMGNPVKAWGVYPGGQSGNPGSLFYDNMLDHWVKGKYYEKVFLQSPKEGGDQILFREVFGRE